MVIMFTKTINTQIVNIMVKKITPHRQFVLTSLIIYIEHLFEANCQANSKEKKDPHFITTFIKEVSIHLLNVTNS